MNRITHSLVGYDRQTERVAEEFDVPDAVLPRAKELACVPADDPDALMCYPLDPAKARDLADILTAKIDTEQRDYYLEGFGEDVEVSYEFDNAEFSILNKAPPADPFIIIPMPPPDWVVWIHNDRTKDHIKVILTHKVVDGYASRHGYEDPRAVLQSLNLRISSRVKQVINQAITGGRATAERRERRHTFGRLELNEHDLVEMLDE